MKHVLVTGINGFVGRHLVRALVAAGIVVGGVGRELVANPEIKNKLTFWHTCDLADKTQVDKLDLSPYNAIISLAGLASDRQSFNEPELYKRINVAVFANICQRLLYQKLSPRIIAVSSSLVYDNNQSMPLTENASTANDTSPYAKSKLAMEKTAQRLQQAGLDCIVIRPFNHIGPGQNEGFILPDLYHSLTEALKTKSPLLVGNLKTKRDYTDVRDVVRAYVLLATAEKASLHHTLYNVCSETTHSGEEILHELQHNIPGSEKVQIAVDQSRIRPSDPIELRGSNERLAADTGWQPEIPFEQTIADFVASKKS